MYVFYSIELRIVGNRETFRTLLGCCRDKGIRMC